MMVLFLLCLGVNFLLCCWRLMACLHTEWPPIGKIAAYSAYDIFNGISS